MLRLSRPSTTALDGLLSDARRADLTYPEVGATKDGPLPVDYRHDAYEFRLGDGDEVFARAVSALRHWQAHIGAKVEVVPRGARVGDEETVVFLLRVGGLWATAPCRVVYIRDEADAFTFAYGTLPGHPEVGEVAFAIDRDDTGDIFFRIVSFSRSVNVIARLGAPITRRIQQRVTRRYLTAIREAASH